MKSFALIIILSVTYYSCVNNNKSFETPNLTATEAIEKAHAHAGGNFWKNPNSLILKGHANFYQGGDTLHHEVYNMWRLYPSTTEPASATLGKIRIESYINGDTKTLVYDGNYSYDLDKKLEKSEADNIWSSLTGYDLIRHALDDTYTNSIIGESMVKHQNAVTIKIVDSNNREVFFDITLGDFKIVKMAFETPQGWRHILYSRFFTKEEFEWVQPGLVELFYDGVKTSEIIWEDIEVNEVLSDSLFVQCYNK